MEGSSFLLGYRITNAINQSDGKSEVDSSGYFSTMLQIEFRQRGNQSFERPVRGRQKFGLNRHCAIDLKVAREREPTVVSSV